MISSTYRWDGQRALLAQAHVEQSLVPALDDAARSELKLKGTVAVFGRVELGAIAVERARVMHRDFVPFLSFDIALVVRNGLGHFNDQVGIGRQVLKITVTICMLK